MSISKTSLALSNLRAFVILIVIAFHSTLAYLGSLRPAAFPLIVPLTSGAPFPSSTAIAGSGSTCSAPGKTSI
jgi:hypothetical protein